ncbi:hypothetical protein HYH85_02775 [Clostridium botulinum]|uniref:hypothetical protein n=1 Tax=Clostridium botulinum TaxID=1491 RepID=UPI001C9B7DC7|nr:hypothetical protein [Clostridium botulinum]MBY6795203.1 hypothetical protein [Clostridium botulinum]MBY6865863.1 hypothetical protein [Clostridium botulinum]
MEKSSFFNAVLDQQGNPDRSYLAEDFARYFSTFIGNGVFPNPANQLQVIAIDNNMQIRIKQGLAWINGYKYENTDDYIFKLDPADGVLNRIDRIALRLDFLERKIKAVVKKGQYASSPIGAILQRDSDAYEIAIGDVYVRAGVISIMQSNITDTRLNSNVCGIVHGTISQVDTTEIFRQYQAWFLENKSKHEKDFEVWMNEFKIATGKKFTDWVDDLKNSLDPNEDIAAQLQMQISENKLQLADITTLTGNKDNLKTINKTNLVSAINEVFTSGNNVKFNTVDALLQLDKSLQITKESKWEDIIKNISKVSTGKKWAKGKIDFQNEKLIYELKDLKFIPQNIFIFINMYGDNGRSDYDSWFASTEEFKFNLSQYARNNISNLNQYLINVKIENNGLIITIPNEFYSTPKGICIGGIYFFITE